MVDKRFWSGAIIVATAVVAGAGALPALLLAPPVPEPTLSPVLAVKPVAAVPAELRAALVEPKVEPVVLRVEAPPILETKDLASADPPAPVPFVAIAPPAEPPLEARPLVEAAPPPTPPIADVAPPPASPLPEPAPAVSLRQALPVEFPPVQPVGVADLRRELPAGQAAPAQHIGGLLVQPQRRAAQAAKRKRHAVRPAVYPIREFFAWRR